MRSPSPTFDDYDFKLIDTFPGYDSASDPTKIAAGYMIRGAINTFINKRGNVEVRSGLKLRGELDETDAGIDSSAEWNSSVGVEHVLRVTDGRLEVESDITGETVIYELLATETLESLASEFSRFVFDSWWEDLEQTDRLVMVRGDDNILHWSGGIALIASVTAAVSGAISALVISTAGTGYAVGDLLRVDVGTGATFTVTTVDGSGGITAIDLATTGSGYTVSTAVTTTTVTGSGTGAKVNISTIGTYGTITKSGEESWAEVGFATVAENEKVIIIDGAEYSYLGGEETTTLWGVSPNPGTITPGAVAIQSVIVSQSVDLTGFNFDFCKTITNQLWVGSYSSRVVYLSADETVSSQLGFLNFEDSNDHVYGDPDNVVLDAPARGIGAIDGKVVLFAGEDLMYLVTPNQNVTFEYTKNSQTILNFQKIERKELAGLQAALAHEFIGNRGSELVWLDQRNQLRSLGTFSTVDSIVPVHVSLLIEDELEDDDFTGGHLRVIGERVHIVAPVTGRDWMYNVNETINDQGQVISKKYWDPPQARGLSRLAVVDGVVHGYSNSHPQMYEMFDTGQWHDDDPSEEFLSYSASAKFSYQNYGRRQGLLTATGVYLEGYMPEGTPLYLSTLMDYQGATHLDTSDISSEDYTPYFFSGALYPSLGDASPGDNPLGEGIIRERDSHDLVPKFRAIVPIVEKKYFEIGLEVFSVAADARWEVSAIGPNVMESSEQPNFIKVKKIN